MRAETSEKSIEENNTRLTLQIENARKSGELLSNESAQEKIEVSNSAREKTHARRNSFK